MSNASGMSLHIGINVLDKNGYPLKPEHPDYPDGWDGYLESCEYDAEELCELAREQGVRVTRIAHGVPMGGELEYIDGNTLSHAFAGRQDL